MSGIKPKGRIVCKWSSKMAYAIGLLATDGYLSKNKRHIVLVSKDFEQIKNFSKCLGLSHIKIGIYSPGGEEKAFRIQFGDVLFYKFFENIGLKNKKSTTIGNIKVPKKYLFDYLRGAFDGDGYFYSYWDKRWKSSYMFYTGFVSASSKYINWLQSELYKTLEIKGHITKSKKLNTYYQLKYAKKESIKLLKRMYSKKGEIYLSRKKLKINKALGIIGMHL